MFQDLIKTIQESVIPTVIGVEGKSYASKSLHLPPAEPTPTPLKVSGLGGLIDYIKADPDSLRDTCHLFIQVQSAHKVVLISQFDGRHCNRVNPIVANCDDYIHDFSFGAYQSIEAVIIALQSQFCDDYIHDFSFGAYQSIEAVIIALQSQFWPTDDRAKILEVLGNLRSERVATEIDDGVTQNVTTRKTLAYGLENVPVPRIVTLMPYRTFAEVDQPASNFILRLKMGEREGQPTQAALFEADGGRWKLEAIESIRTYLDNELNQSLADVDQDQRISIIA
jgi:hypothetical protein